MGHGIAEVAALAGFDVSLYDIKDEFVSAALDRVRWSLSKFAEKKTISEEASKVAFARIEGTSDLAEAVAHAVVAGEVGAGLGGGDQVVGGDRVIGIRHFEFDTPAA